MTAPDDVRARFEAAWNRSIYSRCAVPNESFKEIAEQFYRAAHADMAGEVRELVEAAEEVCRISDRKHDAWDRLKAALAKFHPTHQEKNDVLP